LPNSPTTAILTFLTSQENLDYYPSACTPTDLASRFTYRYFFTGSGYADGVLTCKDKASHHKSPQAAILTGVAVFAFRGGNERTIAVSARRLGVRHGSLATGNRHAGHRDPALLSHRATIAVSLRPSKWRQGCRPMTDGASNRCWIVCARKIKVRSAVKVLSAFLAALSEKPGRSEQSPWKSRSSKKQSRVQSEWIVVCKGNGTMEPAHCQVLIANY